MPDQVQRPAVVTPEQLAQQEAIARALLDPTNRAQKGGYGIAISNILDAIVGQTILSNNETIRQRQLRNIGAANVSQDRRIINAPPFGEANQPSTVEGYRARTRQQGSRPQVFGATTPDRANEIVARAMALDSSRRQAAVAPQVRPQSPVRPQRPPGLPASEPDDAIITGAATPSPTAVRPGAIPRDTGGFVTTISRELDRERERRTGVKSTNVYPEDDVRAFRSMVGKEPDPMQLFYLQKYGPEFAAEVTARPDYPMRTLFRNFYKGQGTPDQAFLDSIPASLSHMNPDDIRAAEWHGAWARRVGTGELGNIAGVNIPNFQTTTTPTMQSQQMRLGGPTEDDQNQFQPTAPLEDIINQILGQGSEGAQSIIPGQAGVQSTLQPQQGQQPSQIQQPQLQQGGTGGLGQEEEIYGRAAGGASGGVAGPMQSQAPEAQSRGQIPQRIGVNTDAVEALERRLSDGDLYVTTTPEQRDELAKEYRKLTEPKMVDYGHVLAWYDAKTGVLISSAPKPYTIQIGRSNLPYFAQPGGAFEPPAFGEGGSTTDMGTSSGATGTSPRIGTPRAPGSRYPAAPGFPGGRPINPSNVEEYQAATDIQREADTRKVAAQDEKLKESMDAHNQALALESDLNFIDSLTQQSGPFSEGGQYRGPGADWFLAAQQVLKNFFKQGEAPPLAENTPSAEGIRKVIVQLGSQATRQLSNRPANFEFQTILRAFPGIETSYEGARLLIEYLRQVQIRIQGVAELADEFSNKPISERGSWLRTTREYYQTNPITYTIPPGRWLTDRYGIQGPITITTKTISPEEERTLPSNIYFFRNGKLKRGDGPIQ